MINQSHKEMTNDQKITQPSGAQHFWKGGGLGYFAQLKI